MDKIEIQPNGCWQWTGNTGRGYGRISANGRPQQAHRVGYELLVGPIPEGLTLDHLCRNRGCVNPAHVEPVTHRENVLRGEGVAANRARQTHCKRGHPFNDENTCLCAGKRYCRPCQRLRRAAYRLADLAAEEDA